jgi:L-ascorbate metabolism protein UlaG (beta-lactamase superfamily)
MFDFAGKVIHVDPWSKLTDYTKLPKADLILITHQHGDHYDTTAINQLIKKNTTLILNSGLHETINKGEIMKNGDSKIFEEIKIEAVPAYNITPGREKFHPTGRDNGYVFNFGNRRVYVAGDTENIPEMAFLKNIYIAFLPMNQPYTMLPEQVVDAVDKFKPKILYPYHYGETDLSTLNALMKAQPQTEVKIKPMK